MHVIMFHQHRIYVKTLYFSFALLVPDYQFLFGFVNKFCKQGKKKLQSGLGGWWGWGRGIERICRVIVNTTFFFSPKTDIFNCYNKKLLLCENS